VWYFRTWIIAAVAVHVPGVMPTGVDVEDAEAEDDGAAEGDGGSDDVGGGVVIGAGLAVDAQAAMGSPTTTVAAKREDEERIRCPSGWRVAAYGSMRVLVQ
jgi:hypothetical protein